MTSRLLFLCLVADHALRCAALTRIRHRESSGVVAADSSIDIEVPLDTGAACLDGTPYVFRIRPGDSQRWTMRIHSYGTCLDEAECAEMAQSEHGTSSVLDDDSGGCSCKNMDGDSYFQDCTCVDMFYCDGAWFASNRDDPIEVNGSKIYLRGRRNLDAAIDIMKESYGLGSASDLAIHGDSSGGLMIMIHLDDIADKLPGVKVRGMPIAGFTIDSDSCCSPDNCCLTLDPSRNRDYCCYMEGLQTMYEVQNITANPSCEAYFGVDSAWRCLYGVYAASFTKTPMFIMNSEHDFWQLIHMDGLDSETIREKQGATGDLLEETRAYGKEFQKQLNNTLQKTNHSTYISSCICHASCAEGAESFWDVKTPDGTPITSLIGAWYDNPMQSIHGEFNTDPNYDCDPTGTVLMSQRPMTFRD